MILKVYERIQELVSFIGCKLNSLGRVWFEGTFVRHSASVLTTGVWLDWSLTAGETTMPATLYKAPGLVLTTGVWLDWSLTAGETTAPIDALQSPWLGLDDGCLA